VTEAELQRSTTQPILWSRDMLENSILAAEAQPRPETTTAAHALLDVLIARGVEVVFGIPGGAIGAVYDACADRRDLRVITNRHETAAVFAAMAYARVTGRPAAVLVTSGPGFTNAITGIAAAYCEELPVIVIAGEVPTRNAGRFALQDGSTSGLDVIAMARPVTRAAVRIERADGLEGVVHRAVDEATGERPGPVLLSLPLDVSRVARRRQRIASPERLPRIVAPDAAACAEAAALLAQAKRPLLLLGSGARAHEANLLAVELCERTGAMAAVTAHAKGAFPERHPAYLGVLGFGGHPAVRGYLGQADVVCVLGSRLGDISTNGWSNDLAGTTLVHVDRDPSSVGRNYETAIGIVGDVVPTLRRFVENLPADVARKPPRGRALDLDLDPARRDDASPLKPQWVVATLERELPSDTVYTVDIGEHAAFAIHHLRVDRSDRFHMFAGLGSMGSGFCGALGVKVARPRATVVSIVGDGGFAMHAGELLTCVESNIPVVFVVMNDGRYGMVDAGNKHIYGRACPGLPSTTADIAAMASACGAVGVTIKRASDLSPGKLASLLALGKPVVLDVRIDRDEKLSLATRVASLAHFSAGGRA
jgi:acetolactate synthase-1/2/3 large subunit